MSGDLDGLRAQAAQLLRRWGMPDAIRDFSLVSPVVSPMCRGADWNCLRVETSEAALFLKILAPDAAGFVSVRDAAAGVRAAASQGLSPELRFAFEDAGAMAVDLLSDPWREARLGDLANPAVLQEVLRAKRLMHRGPALDRVRDVFTEIDVEAAALTHPPSDLAQLLDAVHAIRDGLGRRGIDRVPCHADGTASNVMIGPAGSIMLADFDCAGMADPHYDIGVVLNEVCAIDEDWDAAGALAYPEDTVDHVNRCRLYGVADDLLWGLWGLASHARSTRTDLEFLKYGQWRLLQCRAALRDPGHAKRLSNS